MGTEISACGGPKKTAPNLMPEQAAWSNNTTSSSPSPATSSMESSRSVRTLATSVASPFAYAAYRLSLGGEEAPVIDGLTGDQRFFLGWAQIWRRLYREQELLKRLINDPHSPSEYRVNGIVRNMDAWYKAFDVPRNAELFIDQEDRIRIW